MNPERATSFGNLVITTVVDGETVVIGEAKTIEATIERSEESKGIKLFSNANNGFSGTFTVSSFESIFMRKMRLSAELNHLLDVIKYARHSKKLDKAYKKYAEVYEEYLDIE